MEKYTYTKGDYNIFQLCDEIFTSINKKIIKNDKNEIIDGFFETSGDTINIFLEYPLTGSTLNNLNDTVSNHVVNVNYEESKKFKINNSNDDPRDIDYDIMGFNKKRTINKGELNSIEYYRNYTLSSNTYSDLILKEERIYTKDALGIVQYRDLNIEWYLNDNTVGSTKSYRKYYDYDTGIKEGMIRRDNIINKAKVILLNGLNNIYGSPQNQQYAFDFLLEVSSEMIFFKEGYTQPLIGAVSASTKTYLTVDIKNDIINELTF